MLCVPYSIIFVGVVGVEPTRDEAHTILSRTRMPIPPHALYLFLCWERDSNPQGLLHMLLRHARMPISPPQQSGAPPFQ